MYRPRLCRRRVARRPDPAGRTVRLAALALVPALGGAGPAAAQVCPAPEPDLVVEEPAADDPEQIRVSSDGAEVTREGNAVLKGKVRVRQGDRTLTAEDARYDATKQSFDVSGSVEFRSPEVRLSGDSGAWNATTGGRFGNGAFELPARSVRGRAGEIVLAPDGDLGLRDVEYTSCPVGQRDWFLRADRIDIDQEAQQGTGRDVTLEFKGVPILYAPVVSFPVGDARKSGFLFPVFGQSQRNGFELSVPYYFNLAPNYDATLVPGVMSKRGLSLGGELRYLTPRSRGQFLGDWVPDDRLADRDRAWLRLLHQTDFTSRLRLDARLGWASDTQYFEDFGLGPEGTSVLFVERMARVTYLDRDWRAHALVQEFQTIDQTIDPLDRPYTRAPQVLALGRWGRHEGPELAVRGEAVNFVRDAGVTGSRYDVEPVARWAWRRPGAFVVPAVGYRATAYRLRDAAPGVDDSPTRTAPFATLDAGLVFERDAGRQLQTVEPRILYAYVPFREQSDLPLFDTGLPDLNLIELFRPQRYVGGDRLGDSNQVAFGATGRLVDAGTGRQLIEATVGQIRYFEPPRVRLPDEPPVTADYSDLIAQLSVTAYRNWNVRFGAQWNPAEDRFTRSEVRTVYTPDDKRTLGLGYRFRRDELELLDATLIWPIGRSWSVYGRHVYSLQDDEPIETYAGLEYRACCWRVRTVGRRFVSSRTGERDTGISVQLELNGLSNVGGTDPFAR